MLIVTFKGFVSLFKIFADVENSVEVAFLCEI